MGALANGFYDANEPSKILGHGNKQISDINVLLPISHCSDCRKAAFNISAINGCYQWEVSHPNMIELNAFTAKGYPECANIAQLSAVSLKSSKSLIWITGRDRNSGQILRCEAKLGVIARIEVQTHLRQFYVEDYEHLQMVAYDEQGNIFNSLEGFRFDWNIESGTDIVKFASMKEAAHKSSDIKREMEQQKVHTDMLFLKGIRTGTAVLSVKLVEPGYESVALTYVTLTITEPFVVIPQKTVYLLPTSKFQFQLAKVSLQNNDMQFFPIQLPSKQYEWNIDVEEKGDIGEDGLFISKDKEGMVHVLVVDKYIANNTADGSVKIVHPALLDIEIQDVTEQMLVQTTLLNPELSFADQLKIDTKSWESNWILVEEHIYLLKVFIFDRDKMMIELTENLIFSNFINPEYFQILKTNKISSEIIVRATKATKEKILLSSTLKEIVSQSPYYSYPIDQYRLRSEKEVLITKPVQIIHPTDLVLLPLIITADAAKNGELWQLQAEGGSGYYQWSILNANIADVSGSGLVRSKEIGRSKILLRDSLNLINQKTIDLEVTSVFSLVWLEDHIEILKSQEEAYLNVIALDQKGRKFTNCTAVAAQFEMKSEDILTKLPTLNTYSEIRAYILNNEDLITLRQSFEDHPTAITQRDIPSYHAYSDKQKSVLMHNNFGVCQQIKVKGLIEGLGRVRAFFGSHYSATQSRLIESNYAEVASYYKLQTMQPSYNIFFSDLQQRNQASQDEQQQFNFNKFYIDGTFDVTFGASVEWKVQGGTNFWKDFAEKYQVQESHFLVEGTGSEAENQVLHFDSLQEQAANFKYAVSCGNPPDKAKHYRFKVNLNQQNQVTRQLLRPAHHKLSIVVHCEAPKEIQLYWAQEERRPDVHTQIGSLTLKNLPRYKVVNNEKSYFVLVGSRHYVRALMFDSENQVMYNHSSILTELRSSDESKLQVKPYKEGHYDDQVIADVYDKIRVQIQNYTGTVFINAHSVGYITRYLHGRGAAKGGYGFSGFSSSFGGNLDTESLALGKRSADIRDSLRIEIVQNVDIQPKYKSIYLHKDNSFRFQILHGSGRYSVSVNNSDICDKHHIEGDGFVTIYPRKEGAIEVRVEDLELPDSVMATAELLVADINRLEIDSPGTLIEQGSQMELLVTAFDTYNAPFDEDQYLLMKFTIEIEQTQQRERGLIAEPLAEPRSNNRIFIAKGQEPGLYQLTAISQKYIAKNQDIHSTQRTRVSSEVLKIEVFPLLQIQPGSLLLTPEMRYTLQIVGGPSRSATGQSYQGGAVEIKFDVEDKSIATVDVFREITGHDIGDTHLFYEIIQLKLGSSGERRSIISKKTIPIRVRLVSDIEIPYNNQRTVYQASMIKLIALLKYQNEYFTHGIAPISYAWNCTSPTILSLSLPAKSDITGGVLQNSLIMASKKIRNNEFGDNEATFLSTFNSSTIYSVGGKAGEALVSLQLAIEYPYKYRTEKNWFGTKIIVRVNEKLIVEVPEYINNQEKETHLYLMPPHTYTKIDTNKKTRLRLGYSQQSVYDYSTNSYQYKDSATPIIQLINDEGIRTFDKYGKVTVIIEENQAFSDQVVMLNVLITDIYNLAAKDAYQGLSFPLGSKMSIPLKFQNEHAHSFANNIEGIEVGIELSHPRVVSAQLDQFNQTIQMRAEGSGECNVIVYLVKQPQIFDVFRVRVSSVVKPYSPVYLHVGGQVQFKIMNSADYLHGAQAAKEATWSSNNPSVLDVNQATGEARGLSEGRAEILLSNHISAASIAIVSKVRHAEIDELSRKNLIVNTDDYAGEVRVRVRLYLHDQMEELMPSVQFDGVTLIKQNVGINCQSDLSDVLEVRGEVNEMEGFFCILSYRKSSSRQAAPKDAKVSVTIYGPNPNKPQDLRSAIYTESLISFEVSFISKISVESYYRSGVHLNKDHRTARVKVYSNTPFSVFVENQRESDRGFNLVKYRVNKTEEDSSEYSLYLAVPKEITHDFESLIYIVHPTTQQRTVVPISFQSREGETRQAYYSQKTQGGILSGLYTFLFGSEEAEDESQGRDDQSRLNERTVSDSQLRNTYRDDAKEYGTQTSEEGYRRPDYREPEQRQEERRADTDQRRQREEVNDDRRTTKSSGSGLGNIMIWALLFLLIIFVLMNFFNQDPFAALVEWVEGRRRDSRRVGRQDRQPPAGIRNSLQNPNMSYSYRSQPVGGQGIQPSTYNSVRVSPNNKMMNQSPLVKNQQRNQFGAGQGGVPSAQSNRNQDSVFGSGAY